MQFLLLHIRRFFRLAEAALLRHGTQPQTMFFLVALSAFDGFVPMLPAEAFVVALGILQPQRGKVIVLLFAVASGRSMGPGLLNRSNLGSGQHGVFVCIS